MSMKVQCLSSTVKIAKNCIPLHYKVLNYNNVTFLVVVTHNSHRNTPHQTLNNFIQLTLRIKLLV